MYLIYKEALSEFMCNEMEVHLKKIDCGESNKCVIKSKDGIPYLAKARRASDVEHWFDV